MGEATLTRRSFSQEIIGATLLADVNIATSVTNLDISGLNIAKGEKILLVAEFINGGGGSCEFWLTVNGNNTVSNYVTQSAGASITSVSNAVTPKPMINYCSTALHSIGKTNATLMVAENGYFIVNAHNSNYIGGNLLSMGREMVTSLFTVTSVTSIRITAQIANGIGIGSRFQLYKVGEA